MPDARLQKTRDAYREPRLSVRVIREYDISTEQAPRIQPVLIPASLLKPLAGDKRSAE